MGRPKSTEPSLKQQFVGTKDAAAMLGVSVSTVQKLVETGVLEAWRTQGGHRRIPLASVKKELAKLSELVPRVEPRALKLLIVEDNAVARAAYARMIGQWGGLVQVDYAEDGAQALLALAQLRPDVLITDLAMKPFDGLLLIKTVRSHPELSDLRVVIVSGVLDRDAAVASFDARTVVYAKPLQFDRLAGYLDAQVQSVALAHLTLQRG